MKRFMYATENGIFKGLQDVTDLPVRQIYKSVNALRSFGRDGYISDKGISICCVCKVLLHEAEIPAGQISHGYCEKHYREELDRLSM